MEENHDEYKTTKSKFGREMILHNGFVFNFGQLGKGFSSWRCKVRSCTARFHVYDEGGIKCSQHNHDPKYGETDRIVLNNEIKKVALLTEYDNKKIYSDVFLKKNWNVIVKRKTIYKNISNMRKKTDSISPDEKIPYNQTFTYKKEKFVRIQEEQKTISYYTDKFLEYLKKSNIWIADGTFLSAPKEFMQVYVIYCQYLNLYIPIQYILMENRQEILYMDVLTDLKKKIDYHEPNYLIMDHEKAVINAFKTVFSKTTVFFCITHFSNNIFASIKKHSLSNFYSADFKFKELIGMLKSMLFLPDRFINSILTLFEQQFLAFDDISIGLFFNNFKKSYFSYTETAGYDILPEYKCHFRLLNKIPLTTNIAEGYNSILNYSINFKKPSLIEITKRLIDRQAFVEDKISETLKQAETEEKKLTVLKYNKILQILKNFDGYCGLDGMRALSLVYKWAK